MKQERGMARDIGRMGIILLAFSAGFACRAETVSAVSSSELASPGAFLNALELQDLGIDPSVFLFTGNTMYDYAGVPQLQLIGANLDPAVTTSLDDIATSKITRVLLTLPDSADGSPGEVVTPFNQSSPSSTPEPPGAVLVVSGISLLAAGGWLSRRAGASFLHRATNCPTDSSSARDPNSGISVRTSRA